MSDEKINYYGLSEYEEKQLIGDNETKQQVYRYFQLGYKYQFILENDEQKLSNDILFNIYLSDDNDLTHTLLYQKNINSNKILDGCLTDLKMDTKQFIKIFTYLFLKNNLLISPEMNVKTQVRERGPDESYLPTNQQCGKFLIAIDDIINRKNNRIIYLTSYTRRKISKIIANKMDCISNSIDDYKHAIQEARGTVDDIKGQIITIVGLLVSIVPLMTTNINLVNNSGSFDDILLSNGILILVIGVIFSMINQFVDKKFKFKHLCLIGVILICIAFFHQNFNFVEVLLDNISQLIINLNQLITTLITVLLKYLIVQ